MTITEFLLARIDEDEAAATRVVRRNPGRPTFSNNDYGLLLVQPARVLAECAAKRRIVDEHKTSFVTEWVNPMDGPAYKEPVWSCSVCDWFPTGTGCNTLRAIASVYADHPDYDQAWGL